jgi:hypothetical protein
VPSPRSTRAPQGLSCHAHNDGFAATTTAMQTDHSPDTSAETIAPPRDGVSGAERVTTLTVCNNARSEAKREPLCGGEGLSGLPAARPGRASPPTPCRLLQDGWRRLPARACARRPDESLGSRRSPGPEPPPVDPSSSPADVGGALAGTCRSASTRPKQVSALGQRGGCDAVTQPRHPQPRRRCSVWNAATLSVPTSSPLADRGSHDDPGSGVTPFLQGSVIPIRVADMPVVAPQLRCPLGQPVCGPVFRSSDVV